MTQQTSNPWAWGGLTNTGQSILADINAAARIGGRTFIGNWLNREFDGQLAADPLSPNAPPIVATQNAADAQRAGNYMGTGLSQTEVFAVGAAALAIIGIAIVAR